jgi:hypothetical protein
VSILWKLEPILYWDKKSISLMQRNPVREVSGAQRRVGNLSGMA